jgi:hypothetical protein
MAFVVVNTTFLVPAPWWPLRIAIIAAAAAVSGGDFYGFSSLD